MRYLLILLMLCNAMAAVGKTDSVFVKGVDNEWYIPHRVAKGETLFMLSRRYHVPPAILANVNELTYQAELKPAMNIIIPLGAYNYIATTPQTPDALPIYYRVQQEDNLYRISRTAGVAQRTIQQWNGLADNKVENGQALLVGWILYDATKIGKPAAATNNKPVATNAATNKTTQPAAVQKPVTAQRPAAMQQPARPITYDGMQVDTIIIKKAPDTANVISEEEELYMRQTNNETNKVTERGAAVFFKSVGKTSDNIYAFHNTASRGTIIKVHNPGTGQSIFVKVLGPMPGTKQYHNSIIGISGAAKKALGVSEDKTWCELTYAGY